MQFKRFDAVNCCSAGMVVVVVVVEVVVVVVVVVDVVVATLFTVPNFSRTTAPHTDALHLETAFIRAVWGFFVVETYPAGTFSVTV